MQETQLPPHPKEIPIVEFPHWTVAMSEASCEEQGNFLESVHPR